MQIFLEQSAPLPVSAIILPLLRQARLEYDFVVCVAESEFCLQQANA